MPKTLDYLHPMPSSILDI